jgi:DNA-binding NtrC family response regulator
MLGVSAAIRAVEEEVDHAARSGAKVLVTGESGVGKEVVARLIHDRGARRSAPLVTINCAGIPDSLLESEMFGHVRGSFTDAHRDKTGYLERAHGGTIFMDEIGEMSLRMQALLLRFLETGEIQRVGSDRKVPSLDVRVIAATHRRLIDLVAEKTFREDLYYRLNVIHINVPPLRDRRDDVFILAKYFVQHFADSHRIEAPEFTPEAADYLANYRWPGNVRELRNVIERVNIMVGGDTITAQDLGFLGRDGVMLDLPGPAGPVAPLSEARDQFEKDYILRTLAAQHGNMSRTAEVLGVERSNLYKKLRAFGITPRGGT